MRNCVLFVLGLAACGTSPDSRPVTFDVVTLEVLAPSCGEVQCHSTTTNTRGYALDTLDAARACMRELLNPSNGRDGLQTVITSTGHHRMPPDYPLAHEDIDLIDNWIGQNEPGL